MFENRPGWFGPVFFYVGEKEFPLKMWCARCVSFIYNDDGHGKVAT
jgi:hypothetical protein